jgi:hypothetical protein
MRFFFLESICKVKLKITTNSSKPSNLLDMIANWFPKG